MWKTLWIRIRAYIVSVLIALGIGGLGAFVASGGMHRFKELAKPPLSPPEWLFPIVWTLLYLLMGVAAARVYSSDSPGKSRALSLYGAQLLMNFGWCVLFFGFSLYWAALVWLLVFIVLTAWTALSFWHIHRLSGLLMLPYLLWLLFACYLNAGIAWLNMP